MAKSKSPIRYQKNGQKRTRDRVRSRLVDSGRNRLLVVKSCRYTEVVLISTDGKIITSMSSKQTEHFKKTGIGSNVHAAKELGVLIGKKIVVEKLADTIAFDRNGYPYHGRVSAVAAGAREAGVNF